ncbi:MAG: hypothetical protein ACP5NS_01070 [Candidatus Pacearchaeota archaeon]
MTKSNRVRTLVSGLALMLLLPSIAGNKNQSGKDELKWKNLNCVRVDYDHTRTAHYFIDRDGDSVLDEYVIARYSENKARLPKELTAEDVTYHRIIGKFYDNPLIETPVKTILEGREKLEYQQSCPEFMERK